MGRILITTKVRVVNTGSSRAEGLGTVLALLCTGQRERRGDAEAERDRRVGTVNRASSAYPGGRVLYAIMTVRPIQGTVRSIQGAGCYMP